ncbi:MAG: metallophosphoesterase, partial [Proteobacteria bacterium]|nr:metallophosphoesterase [Pseudomonadota bacterium]
MRIAILSDIHGNLGALEAVSEDMRNRAIDAVVNLGDSLSGPLLPMETAQFLMAQDWIHLAGNHERQILTLTAGAAEASDVYARSRLSQKHLDWIASLRPWQRYSKEVLLCHGTPDHDQEYFLETVAHGRARLASAQEIQERLGTVDAT